MYSQQDLREDFKELGVFCEDGKSRNITYESLQTYAQINGFEFSDEINDAAMFKIASESYFLSKYDTEIAFKNLSRFKCIINFVSNWEDQLIELGLINDKCQISIGFTNHLIKAEIKYDSDMQWIPRKEIRNYLSSKFK